jgi:Bcr/CflA subfamily drug resistance transporter
MAINIKPLAKLLLVLSPARAMHGMGLDVLLTSMPLIQASLYASQAATQLVVSAYVMAAAVAHLFIGPSIDKFGRRPVMLASMFVYMLGSLLCALSHNITMLILARSVQGAGSCGGMIVAFAIVRDLFDETNRAKVFSYINGITSLSPLLAPIGGLCLCAYFASWHVSFYFLTLFSLVTFLLSLFLLQETKPLEIKAVTHNVIYEYWKVLTNFNFFRYVVPGISSVFTLLMFFSISSVLITKVLHGSSYRYSMMFASNALVFMLSSFSASIILRKISVCQCVMVGSLFMIIGSLLSVGSALFLPLSFFSIFVPNYLQTFGSGIMSGSAVSGALEPFKHNAGIASAMYGFLQFGVSSLIVSLIMLFDIKSMLLPAIAMLVLGVTNILLMRSVLVK